MKTSNFALFNQCLESCTNAIFEQISKIPECEEKFMKFLKYVEILDAKDQRKIEGQKLITRIFELDKFKAYQNQSL
jgi:hypothetical protein